MDKNIPSIDKCKKTLDGLLDKVKDAYATSKITNPIDNNPKRCEGVLIRKLGETYNFFLKTKNPEYKRIYNQTLKEYDNIINKKIYKPRILKLKEIEEESTFIYFDEKDDEILARKNWTGIID